MKAARRGKKQATARQGPVTGGLNRPHSGSMPRVTRGAGRWTSAMLTVGIVSFPTVATPALPATVPHPVLSPVPRHGDAAFVTEQVQADVRPYRPGGLSISGGPSRVAAPAIAPGEYLDSFPTAGENPLATDSGKYYRFILHPGDTPYFSATQVLPPRQPARGTDIAVTVNMVTVDPSSVGCSFTASARATIASPNAVTAVLTPGQVGGANWPQRCPTDAAYAAQVVRQGTAYPGDSLPTELALRVEPRVGAVGVSGSSTPRTNIRPREFTPAHAIVGGTGFDDAPLLRFGTYHEGFTSGETRYFRVHLGWGQRLAYTVTAERDHRASDFPDMSGQVVLYNPLRQSLTQPATALPSSTYLGSIGSVLYGSTLAPVRYTNRNSTMPTITPYSIDGDYYLAVATDFPASNRQPSTENYSLTVDVAGRKETPPLYAAPIVTTTPTQPRSSQARSTATAAIDADRSGSEAAVTGVLVGILLLVLVVVLIARQRRQAHSTVIVAHTSPLSANRMRADRWLGR